MSGLGDPRIYLSARQMSTFTRLRTLCHLNLNLFRTCQIFGCNTESTGSNLFNRRTTIHAVLASTHTFQALATLTGIGLAAETVHGDCHTLMCLLRNGSIRHGTCFKSLYNGINRLYLIDRDSTIFRIIKLHQSTQMERFFFIINRCRILFEQIIVVCPCCLLQKMNRVRIIQMLLFPASHLVASDTLQTQVRIQSKRIKCRIMQFLHMALDIFNSDTTDTAYRVREIFLYKFLGQSDCLEDL